tara:strand:- start:667 stop:1038 length:372 start_codon:yes stop_codon:yes gene_type:complete
MLQLFLFSLFVGIMMIILFISIKYYSFLMFQLLVERKHRDAEYLIETGLIPFEWKRKKIIRYGGNYLRKKYVLRRIKKLIMYFKRSPLVDSEESRTILLNKLQAILSEWSNINSTNDYPWQIK